MTVSVTCVYTVHPYGQRTAAQLATQMAVQQVDPGFLAFTGASITSDTSAVAGSDAVRTIVFNITSAQFQAQFPVDQVSPFLGLMTLPINAFVNANVIESLPVVA
jgi:hypothetical protein